jgi:hypothetical protein
VSAPTPHEAREAVLTAALDVLRHERRLASDSPGIAKLRHAEDALALSARDLTNALDDLPPGDQPKGWDA